MERRASMEISKNFKRQEFACKCGCGYNVVDAELLIVLETIRYHIKEPIYINSGCRCVDHNKSIGGDDNSQHLVGKAADIVARRTSPSKIASLVENLYPGQYGVGRYNGFTHIDVRDDCARWKG